MRSFFVFYNVLPRDVGFICYRNLEQMFPKTNYPKQIEIPNAKRHYTNQLIVLHVISVKLCTSIQKSIQYFIKILIKQLTVDPSGPAIDLHVPVHVIIGTTPLRSVVQQYQTQFGMSTPETPALPSPGPAPNPSVAPTDKLNLRECICNFTSIHNDTFVYYLHCRSTDAV